MLPSSYLECPGRGAELCVVDLVIGAPAFCPSLFSPLLSSLFSPPRGQEIKVRQQALVSYPMRGGEGGGVSRCHILALELESGPPPPVFLGWEGSNPAGFFLPVHLLLDVCSYCNRLPAQSNSM